MWRFVGDAAMEVGEDGTPGMRPPSTQSDWDPVSSFSAEEEAVDVAWGPGESLLAVAMKESASVFNETVLHREPRGSRQPHI